MKRAKPRRAHARPPRRAGLKPRRVKPEPRRAPAKRRRAPPKAPRWLAFVARHGVVLASARGPVPSLAEAVAGEPIVGSWWAHPRGKAIFAALSEVDDSADVRCFKLIDGKITLVHRRIWPALVRLAEAGALAGDQVAAVQQEHLPTGEHRNIVTPFPGWVDDATSRAAGKLSVETARGQLRWLAEASSTAMRGPRRPARRRARP